jgi:hypothetical protein
MDYSPKHKINDMVECKSSCDEIVVIGKILSVHKFEDKPAIYIVKQSGSGDDFTFTESCISIATLI